MQIQDSFMLNHQENPPDVLLPWLRHQESMTDRLIKISGDAELLVLRQGWKETDPWEQHSLGLEAGRLIQREILVSSKQKNCWYAKTFIPEDTFHSYSNLFKRLDNESLGALIFSESLIARAQHLYYPIYPGSVEFGWLPDFLNLENQPLWARVAIYRVGRSRYFCLIEILLPPLGDLG